MRTVLTIGTFDTPHMGHAYLFKECEKYGEVIVGVNTDQFVEDYKGQSPLYDWKERCNIIRAMGYHTMPNDSAGRELIQTVRPNVLAIGSDWARKNYYGQIGVTQDWLDQLRISMLYIPRIGTLSSTELKERAK